MSTLRESLSYEPRPLKFGTSGRRGLVADLTQLEIVINASAELAYLLSLPPEQGGIAAGSSVYLASDLRPSSTTFVPEQSNRGQIAQAIIFAVRNAGLQPVYLGAIPTPALTSYALAHKAASIMITGSHIPFDRNGYKTNSARGELLKKDEAPINDRAAAVRTQIENQPAAAAPFDSLGNLKPAAAPLPAADWAARDAYLERYLDFFPPQMLSGKRILVYQHSAVGRDLLVELLQKFGASVIPAGRSDTFVPIDTEAIDAAQLAVIQQLAETAWKTHGPLDAVVSTDGDSDRPLILGVVPEGASCRVRFFGGDLVGMVVAQYLNADAVVVPISCNDALDRGPLASLTEPKTKIGSPFVIAGMETALARGKTRVVGWEANGGFLVGSDLTRNGRPLKALPTRDAFLPILSVLAAAAEANKPLTALFDALPHRYSKAALLREFPRAAALRIIQQFAAPDASIVDVYFSGHESQIGLATGHRQRADELLTAAFDALRSALEKCFPPALGFDRIVRINYTDGLRLYFANGDVAHVRPSGNADELRIYAVADSQQRADAITAAGIAEPNGILRTLEKAAAK
jgi:phosphomannomutase